MRICFCTVIVRAGIFRVLPVRRGYGALFVDIKHLARFICKRRIDSCQTRRHIFMYGALLTPNLRAVWRTVALVSIIYSAVFTARSSIYPFMQYPKVCLYILFGQRRIYACFLQPASHKNEDSYKRSSYLQFCEILSSTF